MANPIPWWACIALALAGLEYTRDARGLAASYGGGRGGGGGAALRRRLTLSAQDDAEPSLGVPVEDTGNAGTLDASSGGDAGGGAALSQDDEGAASLDASSLVPGVEDTGDADAGTLDASQGGDAAGDADGAGVEDTGDADTLDVSSLLPGMGDAAGASFGGLPSLNASALVPEGDIPNVSEVLSNIMAMEFNVTVPCLSILGILEVVEPCGNLTVPEDGINFTTLFGNFHVPGTRPLKKEVMGAERFLSHYTGLSVLIGVLIWVATTLLIPSRREKLYKTLKDTCGGKLYGEEEDEEDPPPEEEKRARLDPLSKEFIAPGNIYRLLAVLHPGIIGVRPWFGYASKAFICAYMQLYLPYNHIKNVFVTWHFSGIKSPLWFVAHATTFASMVAALGSLCSMFAGKCAKSIRDGAEANVHILSHRAPPGAPRILDASRLLDGPGSGEPQQSDPRSMDVRESFEISTTATALLGEYVPEVPPIPGWAVHANELFWCNMSMFLNIGMSLMLEAAMFLQVATYTGDIGDVAITAVSLYFIFDLDDKVMEADPKLRLKYRRAVAQQTEKRPKESWPRILPVVASTSAAIVKLTVPLGLMGIVLFAWRNKQTGFVIGGDGVTI